jgi:hypothetical protein
MRRSAKIRYQIKLNPKEWWRGFLYGESRILGPASTQEEDDPSTIYTSGTPVSNLEIRNGNSHTKHLRIVTANMGGMIGKNRRIEIGELVTIQV